MQQRRLHLAAALLLTAVTGCRDVTAPQLLALSEQALQARTVPGSELLLRDLFRAGPWASAIAEIDVIVGGMAYTLKALPVENVTVPVNAGDGYPCPRVNRSLHAIGEKQSLIMTGLDFSIPFATEIIPCDLGRLPQRNHRDLSPALWTGGIPHPGGAVAVRGKGDIRLIETLGPCPFLPTPQFSQELPREVTCELAVFEVEINAILQQSTFSGPQTPDIPVVLRRHRIPGVRFTAFCSVRDDFIGCSDEPVSTSP